MTISELRPYEHKSVILRMKDGEIASVKVAFVNEEYEDIFVDIIRTNRPQQYADLSSAAYAIKAEDIASIEELPS